MSFTAKELYGKMVAPSIKHVYVWLKSEWKKDSLTAEQMVDSKGESLGSTT